MQVCDSVRENGRSQAAPAPRAANEEVVQVSALAVSVDARPSSREPGGLITIHGYVPKRLVELASLPTMLFSPFLHFALVGKFDDPQWSRNASWYAATTAARSRSKLKGVSLIPSGQTGDGGGEARSILILF